MRVDEDVLQLMRKIEQQQQLILATITRLEARGLNYPLQDERSQLASGLARFEGVVPIPKRDSKKTSFVNVPQELKKGIQVFNASLEEKAPRIPMDEFNGSLLAWSNSAMASVRTILGRYRDLNGALGRMSLDAVRKEPKFAGRPGKFNRDKSAVIRDIRKVIPIAIVAQSDWAARELLRNTFLNEHSSAKRRQNRLQRILDDDNDRPQNIPEVEVQNNYSSYDDEATLQDRHHAKIKNVRNNVSNMHSSSKLTNRTVPEANRRTPIGNQNHIASTVSRAAESNKRISGSKSGKIRKKNPNEDLRTKGAIISQQMKKKRQTISPSRQRKSERTTGIRKHTRRAPNGNLKQTRNPERSSKSKKASKSFVVTSSGDEAELENDSHSYHSDESIEKSPGEQHESDNSFSDEN